MCRSQLERNPKFGAAWQAVVLPRIDLGGSAGTLTRLVLALWGVSICHADAAAQTPSARALTVSPSFSVTQTFSDNFLASSAEPASDWITRLTAGVTVVARSGTVRGALDYSLSLLLHARHSDRNVFQNNLNTAFSMDLVPGRTRVDVSANVSQSAISAFGVQPGRDSAVRDNATELRTLRIAPSTRGPLGPDFRYSAGLNLVASDAKDTAVGDSISSSADLHIEPTGKRVVTWSADASMLRSDFKAGRATADDRLFGSTHVRLDSLDTQLRASGGVEYSDMASASVQRYSNWGLGATWTPSVRATLDAQYDHRFFGASRRIKFEYRTPLTSWRISKSSSLTNSGGQNESGSPGTAYELLYSQFSSILPDPLKRADFVNAYLRGLGIDPASQPGFLRASVALVDREEISMAWRGIRTTAIFTWSNTKSSSLRLQPGVADDLSQTSEVRQTGLSLDLAHRLTPDSSAGILLSSLSGHGGTASQSSRQRQLAVRYSLRPSANSDLSVGARRGLFDTSPAAYDESAVFVTLGYRF